MDIDIKVKEKIDALQSRCKRLLSVLKNQEDRHCIYDLDRSIRNIYVCIGRLNKSRNGPRFSLWESFQYKTNEEYVKVVCDRFLIDVDLLPSI
jgi:hypothetical protein